MPDNDFTPFKILCCFPKAESLQLMALEPTLTL